MPEGHSIHRLALAFRELFGGQRLAVSSPQGRFADGAALLDGQVLRATEAHGKQLFLGLAPGDDAGALPERWLRIHLGLYGSWTFAGDATFTGDHAIGAPRRRVGEEERALEGGDGKEAGQEPAAWEPPAPRGAVRARILGEHGVADLTGPTACEVITGEEKSAVHERLGPDPLREDGDGEAFVAAVRARRRTVGELLMDQSILAGVGNIYRAEALFRARVHPRRLGKNVPAARLREIWDDLVVLMRDGVETGRIVTVRAEHQGRQPDTEAQRWYVYHRSRQPCLVCGASVSEAEMQARRVFWCPRCQRAPRQ
ncbi:Fpg/Nei family DNA glycosylase [Bogoriella caseilytica]|uniref:DNA-(apurinic or apyrimidinic site) lyase n=1 Tax=Bogoriella caseilytica TaxID=56055 RepID=A0A3N2BF82_9MICO|nr:DNA-formamidopyrimidine glycosylase family protein [Bogoriella caseilytica]ROR73912.1 endonuclease-8/formamidopyrimidine-DNA glycosylase [Bogoriella caseilytica]